MDHWHGQCQNHHGNCREGKFNGGRSSCRSSRI